MPIFSQADVVIKNEKVLVEHPYVADCLLFQAVHSIAKAGGLAPKLSFSGVPKARLHLLDTLVGEQLDVESDKMLTVPFIDLVSTVHGVTFVFGLW
jgi:hypothetical protein